MKKVLIVLLLIACSLSSVASVSARGRGRWDNNGHKRNKKDYHYSSKDKSRAKQSIRDAADYLVRAQRAAHNGHYRHGLGTAYAHQQQARNLYAARRYDKAAAHARRARDIASYIIRVNRDRRHVIIRPGRYGDHDDDIDNQLSIKVLDDKVALKLKINLD